jgi:hypothetical protein
MSSKFSESKKEGELKSSGRVPLKDVVADCERRWFEDALKAAKSGEVDMQSLVGQMFCSGYGVAVDVNQGKFWLQKSADANEDARKSLSNLSVGEVVDIAGMDSQTFATGI